MRQPREDAGSGQKTRNQQSMALRNIIIDPHILHVKFQSAYTVIIIILLLILGWGGVCLGTIL